MLSFSMIDNGSKYGLHALGRHSSINIKRWTLTRENWNDLIVVNFSMQCIVSYWNSKCIAIFQHSLTCYKGKNAFMSVSPLSTLQFSSYVFVRRKQTVRRKCIMKLTYKEKCHGCNAFLCKQKSWKILYLIYTSNW